MITYKSGVISDTSLRPGETANFKIIIQKPSKTYKKKKEEQTQKQKQQQRLKETNKTNNITPMMKHIIIIKQINKRTNKRRDKK